MTARRAFLTLALPSLLILAIEVAPLATGAATLVQRDVLNTHLPMRAALQRALQDEGGVPLVDRWRAGGQPLLGNPNVSALYPDSALLRWLPLLWVHNLRFWLHWFLAVFAMAWLARRIGLSAAGGWGAGVAFAFSGYFVSQLNFHNAVAGVALAPALAAAGLALAEAEGRRRVLLAWCGAASLWALLLVAGEPFVAAMAGLLAGGALLARGAGGPAMTTILGRLAAAAACGTALASPQWVELARILGVSFRRLEGYSSTLATVGSFDPRQALEWFVPFLFGRPDRLSLGGFWGHSYFTDTPPYYFSLYPGLLVIALVAAGARAAARREEPRPLRRAAGWAIAVGFFLSLGRFNPLLAALAGWTGDGDGGASAFRYPIRCWLPLAIGASLLAGRGVQALLAADPAPPPPAWRAFGRSLAAMGLVFFAVWLSLSLGGPALERGIAGLLPEGVATAEYARNERLRWAGLCLFSVALLGAARGILAASRRRPALGVAAMLALHAGSQLVFLRPALARDEVAPYERPSPWFEAIERSGSPAAAAGAGALVHGNFGNLFGRQGAIGEGRFPDARAVWLERRAFLDAYPFRGASAGRRYELNPSPEHLDGYLTVIATQLVKFREHDADRLRLLEAWGVDRLLLARPLDATAPAVRVLERRRAFERETTLYALDGAAPRALLASRVLHATSVEEAAARLTDPGFDPRRDVVVGAADVGERRVVSGVARILAESDDGMEILAVPEGGDPAGGAPFLLVQRAWQPFYRAAVDGAPVALTIANLHRVGIPLPAGPGPFRVRLEADRRPTRRAFAASAVAGLALLVALAAAARREGAATVPDSR